MAQDALVQGLWVSGDISVSESFCNDKRRRVREEQDRLLRAENDNNMLKKRLEKSPLKTDVTMKVITLYVEDLKRDVNPEETEKSLSL